ncbi:MAG: hypothetical protein OEV78_07275 [Spirochaetia bacterium]|nr:hypothetical protein [Spirochaetia bacterium]
MNKKKLLIGITGALILSSISVYAFLTLSISKDFKFNHKHHIDTLGIDCSNCHSLQKDGVSMGYPNHAVCASCHDIENKETCNFCHLNKNKLKSFRTQKAFPNVTFSHDNHEKKGIQCLQCHVNINKKISLHANEGLPEMDTCLNCHKNQNAPAKKNCVFCHAASFIDEKPKSHSPLWLRRHGTELLNDEKIKQCKYCHNSVVQKDCIECHKIEKPASHNVTFENRRHAQISMLDRKRCLVCHEQQTCVACHQRTRPFSHTAMFGSPYNRHCNNCHISGTATGVSSTSSNCLFCHSSAITNAKHMGNAAKIPVGHSTTNCLGCHRFGGGKGIPAMKHPAAGNDTFCLRCHK